MPQTRSIAIAFAFLLTGCSGLFEPKHNKVEIELKSTECRLMEMAVVELASQEIALEGPIMSSCPGRYSSRTRSLLEQQEFSDLLAAYPAPEAVMNRGVGYERAYNRLVYSGVPPRITLILANEELFAEFAEQLSR